MMHNVSFNHLQVNYTNFVGRHYVKLQKKFDVLVLVDYVCVCVARICLVAFYHSNVLPVLLFLNLQIILAILMISVRVTCYANSAIVFLITLYSPRAW